VATRLEDLARQLGDEIGATYPDLVVKVGQGAVRVVGPLRLVEGLREIDRYDIAVVIRPGYPKKMPDVYEVAGRIPRNANHHMYPDGRACLFVPGERWRHWPRGSNLRGFLDGPVRSFFISQAIFERTGEWEFGQRSHGALGFVESYQELIGSRDLPTVLRYLEVLSRPKLRPRSPCPCNSGNAINVCHIRTLAELRGKVPYRDAAAGVAIIRRELEELRRSREK
jgi:hypothetical protein